MTETIIDCIKHNAKVSPDEIAFRYLKDLDQNPEEISCSQLLEQCNTLALYIRSITKPGDRVLLLYPPGLDYVVAFYACLMAGVIAVPLYLPRRNSKSERIFKVAESCQSTIALTLSSELENVKSHWNTNNNLQFSLNILPTDNISEQPNHNYIEDCSELNELTVNAETPAFLQYTSGSTGTPKGVVITHKNIIGNVKHLTQTSGGNAQDVFVNWLPLFHDLGLITAILWPVYLKAPSILMAPATFVRSPVIWLKAITKYKGTRCGAPNFAYDLCTAKVEIKDLINIDLSSWKVAYNAAEPVRASTLDKFNEKFSTCGFNENCFYPGYGMAEATVFITGVTEHDQPRILEVNRETLGYNRVELADADTTPGNLARLVSCGYATEPHSVKIVNQETRGEMRDGHVGEIWFSGPSVSPGYWQLEDKNTEIFNQKILKQQMNCDHKYMRTGDLGFIWEGEIYPTGRSKDLVILMGKNYYPQDIEISVCQASVAIRPGYCAAFSVESNESERLIVVAELERQYFRSADYNEICREIRKQVRNELDITVSNIVLLSPYNIPMTSSGKIQRSKTKDLYNSNSLEGMLNDTSTVEDKLIVEASTDTEKYLVRLWQEKLEITSISIEDDFFDLGGNSVTALELSAQIQKDYDKYNIDIDHLLELPTIAEMAEFIDLKVSHMLLNSNETSIEEREVINI